MIAQVMLCSKCKNITLADLRFILSNAKYGEHDFTCISICLQKMRKLSHLCDIIVKQLLGNDGSYQVSRLM